MTRAAPRTAVCAKAVSAKWANSASTAPIGTNGTIGFGTNREIRPDPAGQLRGLARDLERLRPDWRQPERFFEQRSELAATARRLAQELCR